MPYGARSFVGTGANPDGDKTFVDFVFSGTSAAMAIGTPVFHDIADAAELNDGRNGGNKVTAGANNNTATGGKVLMGTAAGAAPKLIAIFYPETPNSLPANGDSIRCIWWGIAPVLVKTGGTALNNGGNIIAVAGPSASQKEAIPGAFTGNLNVGMCVANGAVVTAAQVVATTTTATVNAFVQIQ